MKVKGIIFSVVIFVVSMSNAQTIKDEIESLEKSFKEFKYNVVIEKGKFLLGDRFTTKDDSLQIYQYILSSAYALNDTSYARQVIVEILQVDPDYSLSPEETSPKIIQFFNYIKNELNQQTTSISDTLATVQDSHISEQIEFKPISRKKVLASVLLPGSGHIWTGNTSKGYLYTSISIVLIGTNLYINEKTDDLRKKYMGLKKASPNFNKRYNDYNNAYKIRNSLLITYFLWNAYCLYDLHRTSLVNLDMNPADHTISLSLRYKF